MDDMTSLRHGAHYVKIKVRLIRDNMYWAVTDVTERDRLLPLVCEGLIYYITNFKIVPAQPYLKPIDTETTIVLDKNMEIHGCFDGSSIPKFKFGLCSVETLKCRTADARTLSDVCGVLVKVGTMEHQNSGVKRLDIYLMDQSLTPLQISLWDKRATIFTVYLELYRHKNVVLVITGLLVKKVGGNIYLSPTPATSIHFNPKYEPIHHLGDQIARSYGEFICRIPDLIDYQTRLLLGDVSPYSTLLAIRRTPLWVHQKVTIMDILLRRHSETTSCIACQHQVTVSASKYYCTECGRNFISLPKSSDICMVVRDNTADATLVLKSRELEQLTSYPPTALLGIYGNANLTQDLPPVLNNIVGKKCTFHIKVNSYNQGGRAGYTVARLSEIDTPTPNLHPANPRDAPGPGKRQKTT
ncbi:hypothetical protein POM88_013741 [Heracleum sosnowskyi]|uniref:Uncharacterized protein n=1 Tax=Heracleum sosnowskyi TaxID=360622 RepID=A0AAD8IZ49_9APIA|nr:hypothetical protein POM88_013741 [Heracleum sosnowskyi]